MEYVEKAALWVCTVVFWLFANISIPWHVIESPWTGGTLVALSLGAVLFFIGRGEKATRQYDVLLVIIMITYAVWFALASFLYLSDPAAPSGRLSSFS